ncbi:metabotropic glutamate receptor 3-like [Hydractinia symbiolongicarpus]|uniref:metabotropic glutamate receptor 3-like n=1 Tax=Hydractinia symbiolongicarpus TaxID=13093 RepID=UPI00254A1A14|nr:metabotropic glutamate receptor 3-like [Hydractinia symbiolongicarpus]
MPIWNEESKLNYQSGFMMAMAMQYAIEHLNNKTSDGYNFDYEIIDANNRDEVNRGFLKAFLDSGAFVIGPFSSETSYTATVLTSTFKILSISYGATYSEFANHGMSKGNMLRTVPSDSYRIDAALEFLKKIKWNYVGVVGSYGNDGQREGAKFVNKLSSIDACLSMNLNIPSNGTKDDYNDILNRLNRYTRIKVLILFTTLRDSRNMFKAIGELNLRGRFYILCMYGCTNFFEVTHGVEHSALGVISLDVNYPKVKGLKKYFLNQRPSNTSADYFKKYWQDVFSCNLKYSTNRKYDRNCSDKEQLSDKHYFPLSPVSLVVNAAHSIGEIVKYLIQHACRSGTDFIKNDTCTLHPKRDLKYYDIQLYIIAIYYLHVTEDGKILDNSPLVDSFDPQLAIKYDFHQFTNNSGSFENQLIGRWVTYYGDANKISKLVLYNNQNLSAMKATCSSDCPPGFIKDRDANIQISRCCWRCQICPRNTIVVNDTCHPCKETEKAQINRNICLKLPVKFIDFDTSVLPYVVVIICVIGHCLVLSVVGFFIKYDSFRIIRASGRDLCYMMLMGIFLVLSCPIIFLVRPTLFVCIVREGLPGVAFLCCYAPLFLKVNRIYRIFNHATKSVTKPVMVSSRSLLITASIIVSVQIALMAVWFISNVPQPIQIISSHKSYITLSCKDTASPLLLLLNLAISVFFMLACTVLAFKTRHYPKNYNEAKYIGISLYITCVAWSIFVPAYFLLPNRDYLREYFMSGICIVIGYITLVGLFGPKIRLLICQRDLQCANENLPSWHLSQNSSTNRLKQSQCSTESSFQSNDSWL